jgi:hypothetical protein
MSAGILISIEFVGITTVAIFEMRTLNKVLERHRIARGSAREFKTENYWQPRKLGGVENRDCRLGYAFL